MGLNLIDALMGKNFEKEFDLGTSKVVLRTLTQNEMNEVMMSVPRTDITMIEFEKIPTLAYSLVSINGIKIEAYPEIQEEIKKDSKVNVRGIIAAMLGKLDTAVINVLWAYYRQVEEESKKNIEQLKKA